MANVTNYEVVSAPTPAELEEIVNARIDAGWQPHAGIFLSDEMLSQALVITDPAPTTPLVVYYVAASTTPAGLRTAVLARTTTVEAAAPVGHPIHTPQGLLIQAVSAPEGDTVSIED